MTVHHLAEGDDTVSHPLPIEDLRESGLLWLINRVVFHPRGFALGMVYSHPEHEFRYWVLLGDGSGPWRSNGDEDDHFRRVEELFATRHHLRQETTPVTDSRAQDDSLELSPSSPVVAAVAAALRAYYGDGPYNVVPVGGAAYAAIAAARPHLEEPLAAELEQIRAERDDAYGQGRDDEADGLPMRYPAVRRRVPTQAERIADAIADGHHRITEDEQTATDAMSDRYGETLDLIATAVQTATDDTLRDSIRSMIRQVRPEALDLWSATPTHRPTTTEETPA